ncbi:MAG: hypothetical protein ABI541_06260, partial [Betaproteobacteria bacterium]
PFDDAIDALSLIAVRPDELQMVCLADYLSHKRPQSAIPGWKECSPPSAEEEICSALASSRHANSNVRAYIGRMLQQAHTCTGADPGILDALAALRGDADPDV